MKKRHLYTLLSFLPGLLFALLASMFVTGAAAGFFWVLLFGDDSWPASAEEGLVLVMIVIFMIVWLTIMLFGYLTGKRLEAEAGLNKRHVLASVALTFLPLLIIVLQQLSVGNLGTPHDSVLCGDYCLEQGYSASGMPPKDSGKDTCFCFNEDGIEVLTVPMHDLRSTR